MPHHTIRAKFSDAAGKPFGGGKLSVLGHGQGKQPFHKTIESDSQGLAVVRLPRGFDAVRAGTQPELESIYRMGNVKDGLHNKTDIDLGPLDDDVDDLEFVHYRHPDPLVHHSRSGGQADRQGNRQNRLPAAGRQGRPRTDADDRL